MQEIIITAIGAGLTMVTTIVNGILQAKTASRNAAKQSILQMIMEDHLAVAEGKLPSNYQNILKEYDIYSKAGGNSYISEKKEEYVRWWHEQEEARQTK